MVHSRLVMLSLHLGIAVLHAGGLQVTSCRPLDGRGQTSPFYLLGWVGGILEGLGGGNNVLFLCVYFVCMHPTARIHGHYAAS